MSDTAPPAQSHHWLDLASSESNQAPSSQAPSSQEPLDHANESQEVVPMKPVPFQRHIRVVVGLIVIGLLVLGVGVTWLFSQVHHSPTQHTAVVTPRPTLVLNTTPTPTSTPTATPTPTPIDKASLQIAVLNGTTQKGLASKTAQQLQQAGFTITKTGNADSTTQTQTVVQFPPGQEAQAALITDALKSSYPSVTAQSTTGATQFTVILGQ
jgi:hypothetical protein